MSTIKQVSTTDIPGAENADREEHDYRPLPPAVAGPEAYFDARVPADILDGVRREARQRVYANSTEEAETIRETDELVFEKVRAVEAATITSAEDLLARNKDRAGQALSYLDEVEALRERLRAGEDTRTIAKEFHVLEGKVRSTEVARLRSMAQEAGTVEAALADPVGRAQRIFSLMPLAWGRTAGLVRL